MRTKLSIVALFLVAASTRGATQQPTFPARVELVTVDVLVFDRQGNPVVDLTRNDFTVREEGRPQEIAAFEAVSVAASAPAPARRTHVSTNSEQPDAAGRWFFVVFDDVNITQFATARARETIVQFIERALRPGDRVMIAPASGGSNWIGELPRDRDDLLAYVQRLNGERRIERGPARIWDHEAIGIALGRDAQAQAQVMRRYFENNILMEGAVTPADPGLRKALDVNSGVAMVQAKAREVYTEARARMQTSLTTLERMAAALAEARGRKTLLFFSEGFIMDTTLQNFRTLVQAARNANVAIHFVDIARASGGIGEAGQPGGTAETGPAIEDRDAALASALAAREYEGTRSIAADTGGTTVSGTNLVAGLTRIVNEGRSYYLLGYSPSDARRDGRFRKIDVRVNRPDVTVRARQGYFAPSNGPEPPRSSPDKLDPAVRAGLDSPFGALGIPLRLTSHVFGVQEKGKLLTLLVAEADPAVLRLQPRDGRYAAMLDSYVLVHDRSRDSLERNERVIELNVPVDAYAQVLRSGLPIQREFALAPGHYQATLLLRDRATGILGSVRHEFEVPAIEGFRITTPIVTDTVQPPAAAGQSPRPVPVAHRTFRAGSRVAVAFEILGASNKPPAGPQVSVAYKLVAPGGAVVASSPAQTLKLNARGQLGVTIGISLPSGASGEHELQISIRDEQAIRVIEYAEPLLVQP